MTRQPGIARHAEQLLGTSVVATAPVAGGDTSTATKLRLSDGTTAIMKTQSQAPDGFFASEAAALRWLDDASADGGVHVPEVLAVDHECLILRWIEPGKTSSEAASAFGRALAATHGAGAPAYGATGSGDGSDGFIGRLRLPMKPTDTWAEFYAVRRVLPYLKVARDRGAIADDEAARVESVIGKLTELIPDEPPARLHGDLWNGNVLWGADGRAWVIDPAAYGGHREVDLAMLALFGMPHLPQVLDAYQDASPLADGWQDRVALHQLFPLLVHAAMFGGGYGSRAADAASRYA
jgi:fructosamine-3-kinase